MRVLFGKTVFITGASSGIGAACARIFAAAGARIILTARRLDKISELSSVINQEFNTESIALALDIRDFGQVKNIINQLPQNYKDINILINNAGLALGSDKLQDAQTENWDRVIDTNLKGLLYVTREIIPGMLARKNGHVINIGSVAGHEIYPGGNVYSATKHAVRAISKSLRVDLLGTPIRVSSVDPGAVETEFSIVRWGDEERAKKFYADFTPLKPQDIADAVLYCATRPPHVDISEIVIYPTDQASANHLHRK